MFDVLVIGGGINGAGIARDAVGRGYSVCLCEAGDLAMGTSSASTKLVHGGLRYLEFYEFKLVRKALMEREILWRMAPHIIWPLRFVLPHHKGLRPAWFLRLGLFVYDYIGGRKLLPPTRMLNLMQDEAGEPLRADFRTGFEYSDCWVDDARLVVLNARDAADKGADIRTRTKVVSAERQDGHWVIDVEAAGSGERTQVECRFLVNAAGPWVDEVLQNAMGRNDARNVRLVRGSHIVVDKLFDHKRSYIFQNADDRIIFAIPYQHDYTLIGTTDQDHRDGLDEIKASDEEVSYLCEAATEYFKKSIAPADVVWTYSGVRPLYDDGASKAQETTRDYVIKKEGDAVDGVLLNVLGGKITTYRNLAEVVLEDIEEALGARQPAWTETSTLPGGDFEPTEFADLLQRYGNRYAFIPSTHLTRLLQCYGTRAEKLLGDAASLCDLGRHFGADLYQAEVDYLVKNEWAQDADDILFRRTKLGIRLSKSNRRSLVSYLAKQTRQAA